MFVLIGYAVAMGCIFGAYITTAATSR